MGSQHAAVEDGLIANLSPVDIAQRVVAPGRRIDGQNVDHARSAAVVRVEPVCASRRVFDFLIGRENDFRHARRIVHAIWPAVIVEIRHPATKVEVVLLSRVEIAQHQAGCVAGERLDHVERRAVRGNAEVPQLLVLVDDLAVQIHAGMSVQSWCLRLPVMDPHVAEYCQDAPAGPLADGVDLRNEWEIVTEERAFPVTNQESTVILTLQDEQNRVARRSPAFPEAAVGVVDQSFGRRDTHRTRRRP